MACAMNTHRDRSSSKSSLLPNRDFASSVRWIRLARLQTLGAELTGNQRTLPRTKDSCGSSASTGLGPKAGERW